MTHDDSLKIKCDQCDHKSIDATRLKFHKAKEHGGLEVPCNFGNCEFKTSKINELRFHREEHRGVIHSCKQCDYTNKSAYKMKRHIQKVKVLHFCQQCSYSSKSAHFVKLHSVVHSEEKPFRCNKCTFSCKTGHILQRHQVVHNAGRKNLGGKA